MMNDRISLSILWRDQELKLREEYSEAENWRSQYPRLKSPRSFSQSCGESYRLGPLPALTSDGKAETTFETTPFLWVDVVGFCATQ